MTTIARKTVTLPTPNGDARQVTIDVVETKRGYEVRRDGHDIGVGPYGTKEYALSVMGLQEGEGLLSDILIAQRRTPMTHQKVVSRDGRYLVMDGDLVIASFPSANDALYSVDLRLGEGLASPRKRFACHI